MARLRPEEIERLKAAGEAKRQARAEKKELKALSLKLETTVVRLSRVHLGYEEMTGELEKDIKALFLPDKSLDFKSQAYRMYLPGYEDLIFYSWKFESLCDSAFKFWDDVLKKPNTSFTGNSILKILGCEANHNLEVLMERHKDKFFKEDVFSGIIKLTVERHLRPDYPMRPEQKAALQNIRKLF